MGFLLGDGEPVTNVAPRGWLRLIYKVRNEVEVVMQRSCCLVLTLTAAIAAGPLVCGQEKREAAQATGGEQLSEKQVSGLPLNKRDFSQLLLLATGTQTDANGAANFTQQFTVNGQRGTATVFAMDGVDTTDPEMGGATFSNFNVDAIEEIKASSGVMAAEVGHGAAGYTEVVSKAGTERIHGSVFEFLRNAALDARNFFDRRSTAQPGRIPPFVRNEFGFTLGGPLVKGRTYYFGQYQGFRQVLGTTQVLPVPTREERAGRNTTAFPGDTLIVPVSAKIAPVLAKYPLPNDPQGPYGARTYAISSKVRTVSDQFSVRVDHKMSEKSRVFARFSMNNAEGPTTNPSQTALDESFGVRFFDEQKNAGLVWTYAPSARTVWESVAGYIRSTPNFPTVNRTQPGLLYGDGLYEAFNSAAGSIMGSYGNLVQVRQSVSLVRERHHWKAGVEARWNADATVFGISPNGAYSFGGGAAYSPVEIRSLSGRHDVHVGDPLPDALSGLLTASPFSYTIAAAPALFAQGERMGNSAVRRGAYNFYAQDQWRISSRVSLSYGLRYEVNSRVGEAKARTSGPRWEDAAGREVDAFTAGAKIRFLINTRPPYGMDWSGWGPRAALDWRVGARTVLRAGGAVNSLLMNLWQCNLATGGVPYVVSTYATAAPGAPLPFENTVRTTPMPDIYTPAGDLVYATGRSTDVKPNTEMDVLRFEKDLAALSTDKQVRPLVAQGYSPEFRNGYAPSWTVGIEQQAGDVTIHAAYVATVGVKLARIDYPNGYGGADAEHAPYREYGPIYQMTSRSHSTYHSLQTSAQKTSLRAGLGFQASYTYSKSLDDTSAVLGGFVAGSSGTVLQTSPQNPRDLRGERGPSTFDVKHVFSVSAIQELKLEGVAFLRPLGRRVTKGWQVLGMMALSSGQPFTVFSGVQQTGVGTNGADRPDAVGRPEFSTSRAVREDYFGRGAENAAYFSIPAERRFGTLGRSTYRGPGFRNFDVSVTKNTDIGRGSNPERVVLQARAEVFNVFNLVNFGLPANIVLGPGFGVINRTAGTSRQIQFSLKILF